RPEHGFDACSRRGQADAVGLSVEASGEVRGAEGWPPDVELADDLRAAFRQHPDVVGTVERGEVELVARPVLQDGVRGRDAKTVATFLGFGTVRVEDPNRHLGGVESDEAVCPETPISIAQRGHPGDTQLQVPRKVKYEVVVAQRLVLNEIDSH